MLIVRFCSDNWSYEPSLHRHSLSSCVCCILFSCSVGAVTAYYVICSFLLAVCLVVLFLGLFSFWALKILPKQQTIQLAYFTKWLIVKLISISMSVLINFELWIESNRTQTLFLAWNYLSIFNWFDSIKLWIKLES
jgi:hypothetical protein